MRSSFQAFVDGGDSAPSNVSAIHVLFVLMYSEGCTAASKEAAEGAYVARDNGQHLDRVDSG
jgi:hypothetical protein